MEDKEFLLTQEGYDNLVKELEYLKTEERYAIAERIKVALGFGDLSENSEYDEAKNAQAANESKIAELEEKVKYARIIDESEIDTKTVQVGNIVKVLDIEANEEETYTIVGSTEVNLAEGKISNESPVGQALLGKKKNDVVEVKAPVGIIKMKILSITK
jgi:transcription elongation factor GreA